MRLPAVGAVCLIALLLGLATPSPPAESTEPVHGLVGHYYTRDLPGSYDLRGFLLDAYGIPSPNKAPNATRVDPQIAFGKGKGFVRDDAGDGAQLVWWTPSEADAVVWKGYIGFPSAGTYYLTTASNGPSAVYLNDARVSLNGGFGGFVPSDRFSLGDSGTDEANSPIHRQYVVPIPIDAARELAIEIRYLRHTSSNTPRGIDLYWVRPNAPRDANGKAIAEIVPTEALFIKPTQPLIKPKVRGANSMISADFLYLSAVPGSEATVTVRLADEQGNPVAGHRVHVSTVQRTDGGSSPDEIVQPQKPTDKNGVATAKLRATGDQHGARLYATDLTDMVDVDQVAEVIFERRREWSLRPPGFAPYYDGKAVIVEPLPLRVGQRTKLTILLANRTPDPADVTASFFSRELNIGAVRWNLIEDNKRITLDPGESRKVSVTWTPDKPDPHMCFKVDMNATFRPAAKASAAAAAHVLAITGGAYALAADTTRTSHETTQENIGPVGPHPCDAASLTADIYPQQIPRNEDETHTDYALRTVPAYRKCAEAAAEEIEYLTVLAPAQEGKDLKATMALLEKAWDKFDACTYLANCSEHLSDTLRANVTFGPKGICRDREIAIIEDILDLIVLFADCRKPGVKCDPLFVEFRERALAELTAELLAMRKCAADPPDAAYRQLAVAGSDTVAEYVQAMTTSMERFQGAQAVGDHEWMAKQMTARRLYQQRIVDAFRSRAKALRARAEKLPPDDPVGVERLRVARETFLERLRSGKLPPEDRKILSDAGVSLADVERANAALVAAKELRPVKGPRETLIRMADSDQRSADEVEQLLAKPPEDGAEGQPGQTLANTFVVGNPKDTPAIIDLQIRRIALPESWQLSIIDATGPAERNTRAGAPRPVVREVTAGARYQVSLPPKTEVRVMAVVVPVGETGVNTTARFAVEGRIGNELLGGIVNEMHVPALVPDLKLPPVGATTSTPRWLRPLGFATLVFVATGLALFVLFRKRRRA